MSKDNDTRGRHNTEELPLENQEREQLASIPIQFLFRSPRIVRLDPSLTSLRDNCPGDISTLLDLFSVDLFKRKPVRNVRDYVFKNKDRLIKAFLYYSSVPVIPSDVTFDDPIGLMAERFVCEYVDRMRLRNSLLIAEEAEKRGKRIELFESAYDDREITPFSRESAATKYGMTPERIRQLLLGKENSIGITLCRGVIQGTIEVDDIRVNPIFQSRFDDIAFSNKYAYDLRSFILENGIRNDKTCRFLLDLLGLTICESNIYFEPLVIKGENITALNHNAAILMKFFTDAALYVSLVDDVAPFLQNKLNNNTELVNIMLDIVRSSDRFESYDGEGGDLYALRWQYLQTIPARIVRIIYDYGGPIHSSDIYEEYNKRALAYGIEPILDEDVTIRRVHPLLAYAGKTGYWSLKNKPEDGRESMPKVREVIDSYLRAHDGKAYLQEVVEYVSSLGLNYSERSIRTYLSSMCRAVREHVDLFIHNDYSDHYPSYTFASKVKNQTQTVLPVIIDYLARNDGRAKMKELVDEYKRQTGNSIRDTTLRFMIDSVPNIIGLEREGVNGRGFDVVLCVSFDEAKQLLEEQANKKRPSHHNAILAKAKELISSSPHGCLLVKTLFDELVQYVPDNRRKNIIYKLIKNSPELETYIVDKKRFVRLSKERGSKD